MFNLERQIAHNPFANRASSSLGVISLKSMAKPTLILSAVNKKIFRYFAWKLDIDAKVTNLSKEYLDHLLFSGKLSEALNSTKVAPT